MQQTPRLIPGQQQIVVSNPNLVQQLQLGKVQIATINGQQVLIRSTGNNQAQIVAQLSSSGQINQSSSNLQVNQANGNNTQNVKLVHNQTLTQTSGNSPDCSPETNKQQQVLEPQQVAAHTPQTLISGQTVQNTLPAAIAPPQNNIQPPENAKTVSNQGKLISDNKQMTAEQQLLIGQPPGTVIKCVTAQVINTPQGPRIVLQGLQGTEFTAQQLTTVQQQVKQQLLKGNFNFHFNLYSIKIYL